MHIGRLFSRFAFIAFLISAAFVSMNAFGQGANAKMQSVSKVTTLISYDNTGASLNSISESRLGTVLELRLRTAGLRVLTEEEDAKDPDKNPYVFLEVASLETSNQGGRSTGYAYSVRLSMRSIVRNPSNGAFVPGELWSSWSMGVAPKDSSASSIEKMVNDLTDSMLNVWLKENPKR